MGGGRIIHLVKQPVTLKRPPRRSGEPFIVQLCEVDDSSAKMIQREAEMNGLTVFIEKKFLCTTVLNHGNVYIKPGTTFSWVDDGTYVFEKSNDGKNVRAIKVA